MNLAELIRNAEAARTGAGELVRDMMKPLSIIALGGMRQHFVDQRGPDGKPWAKLAHPRPDGGDQVLRDKGTMYNALGCVISGERLILVLSHPGANVHNFGAVLTPKKARALAIPLTREAKRVGSPKRNAFPRPLFVIVSQKKKAFLAERVTGGSLVLHYILLKSVKIPQRLIVGFSDKTLDKMSDFAAGRLMDKVQAAFDPKSIRMGFTK